MKKLLTIIALALVLCLGMSAALADFTSKDQYKKAALTYGDEWTSGAADFIAAAKDINTLWNGIQLYGYNFQTVVSNAANHAIHGEYSLITLRGDKYKEEAVDAYYAPTDTSDPDTFTFKLGEDLYYQTTKDGKTVWVKADLAKVDVSTWKTNIAKEGEAPDWKDVKAKRTTYKYTFEEADVEVNVKVSLKPHDKLGGSTTGSDGKVTYKCSCGKEWAAAAPADPATCSHEWAWSYVKGKEPTCSQPGKEIETCILCGKTKGEEREVGPTFDHNWKLVELKAPTCRENPMVIGFGWDIVDGRASYECTECHEKKTRNINEDEYKDLLVKEYGWTWAEADAWDPHTWSYTTIEPTCTHGENIIGICTNCHAQREYGKPYGKGNLDPKYVAVNIPTCKALKKGDKITLKCALCGSSAKQHPVLTYEVTQDDVDNLKKLESITIPMNVHVYMYEWDDYFDWDFTFTIGHSGTLKETDAKKQYVRNEDGFKTSKTVAEAVCGESIWNEYTCSVCESKTIDKKVKDIEHVWGEWKPNVVTPEITQFVRACTICADVEYAWGTDAPGKDCGDGKHTPAVKDPDFNCKYYWVDSTIIDGLEYYWVDMYCSVCGKDLDQQRLPVTHKWELIEELSTKPTCIAEGTNVYVCSVCEASLVLPVDTVDHKLAKVEKPATCNATGTETYWKCEVCNKLFSDEDGIFEIEKPAITDIDPNGHVWDAGVVTTPAAEGTKGVKTFTCTLCGKTKTEEIPALPVPAKYDVEKVAYTKPLATGSAKLQAGTEALKKAYARVTFFLESGDCMIQIVEVEADGTFKAGAEGKFVHISVVIIDVDDAYSAEDAIAHAHGNGGIELD